MAKLHPTLTDVEYWNLRFSLLGIQKLTVPKEAYTELERDILDDLHSYLILQAEEPDPWN